MALILILTLALSQSPLRRALTALQAIPPDSTNVPAESRPLVVEVKHRLRDVVVEIVSAPDGAITLPDRLEEAVVARLAAEGVPLERGPADGEPGNPWDVTGVVINYAPDNADVLVAETTLDLTCATDTSLYVFEKRDERWVLAAAVESNDYEDVSGAACCLEYGIATNEETGSWYLVTAHISCWCTSNWQRLQYQVIYPSGFPYEPAVVFRGEQELFLGAGPPPFTLEVEPHGFTIRCNGAQSLDPGVLVREHVLRYEVYGEVIDRRAPLATRPEDFLDEWKNLSWNDTSEWVEEPATARARLWHERLRTDRYRSQEILFVRPVAGHPGVTEVGLDVLEADLVFTIVERDGAYYVRDVSVPAAR